MMNKQMELFEEGGLSQEGGMVDAESGNEVPVGSTRKEVRDDIPAKLSEGEFVMPADVVRYHGLDKLMALRDEAKMGLQRMDSMGQMGNSDEATISDEMPFGMSDLIVVSEDGRELEMADGGYVSMAPGGSVRQLGPSYRPPTSKPINFGDVMGEANLTFKEYRNAEGKNILVAFVGGVPLYQIPEGYTEYTPGVDEPVTPIQEIIQQTPQTPAPEGRDQSDIEQTAGYRDPNASKPYSEMTPAELSEATYKRNSPFAKLAGIIASTINPLMGLAYVAGQNFGPYSNKALEAELSKRIKSGGYTGDVLAALQAAQTIALDNKGIKFADGILSTAKSLFNKLGISFDPKSKLFSAISTVFNKGDTVTPDEITALADSVSSSLTDEQIALTKRYGNMAPAVEKAQAAINARVGGRTALDFPRLYDSKIPGTISQEDTSRKAPSLAGYSTGNDPSLRAPSLAGYSTGTAEGLTPEQERNIDVRKANEATYGVDSQFLRAIQNSDLGIDREAKGPISEYKDSRDGTLLDAARGSKTVSPWDAMKNFWSREPISSSGDLRVDVAGGKDEGFKELARLTNQRDPIGELKQRALVNLNRTPMMAGIEPEANQVGALDRQTQSAMFPNADNTYYDMFGDSTIGPPMFPQTGISYDASGRAAQDYILDAESAMANRTIDNTNQLTRSPTISNNQPSNEQGPNFTPTISNTQPSNMQGPNFTPTIQGADFVNNQVANQFKPSSSQLDPRSDPGRNSTYGQMITPQLQSYTSPTVYQDDTEGFDSATYNNARTTSDFPSVYDSKIPGSMTADFVNNQVANQFKPQLQSYTSPTVYQDDTEGSGAAGMVDMYSGVRGEAQNRINEDRAVGAAGMVDMYPNRAIDAKNTIKRINDRIPPSADEFSDSFNVARDVPSFGDQDYFSGRYKDVPSFGDDGTDIVAGARDVPSFGDQDYFSGRTVDSFDPRGRNQIPRTDATVSDSTLDFDPLTMPLEANVAYTPSAAQLETQRMLDINNPLGDTKAVIPTVISKKDVAKVNDLTSVTTQISNNDKARKEMEANTNKQFTVLTDGNKAPLNSALAMQQEDRRQTGYTGQDGQNNPVGKIAGVGSKDGVVVNPDSGKTYRASGNKTVYSDSSGTNYVKGVTGKMEKVVFDSKNNSFVPTKEAYVKPSGVKQGHGINTQKDDNEDKESSKIICTAMNASYGFGSYRNAIWLNYASKHLTKAHEVGYHSLFLPLVKLAYEKDVRIIRKILEHGTRRRTSDIRAEMRGSKRDTLGRIYRSILEPTCYLVGKIKIALGD